jgi:hypothetical protein
MTLPPFGAAPLLRPLVPPIARTAPFVPLQRYASCIVQRNMECLCLSATAVLLLRHRGRIPPFSSYGGILGAVTTTAPFFTRIALHHQS